MSSISDFDEEAIKRQKTVAKTKISKAKTFAEKFNVDTGNIQELVARRVKLQADHKECESLMFQLLDHVDGSANELKLQEEIGDVDEIVVQIDAKMATIIQQCDEKRLMDKSISIAPASDEPASLKRLGIKLPEMKLPIFDGNYMKWPTFKDTYVALVHRSTQVDDVVKFTLLLSALSEDVQREMGPVTLTELGYQQFWKNLKIKYDNTRKIVEAYIESIWDLPSITKGSAKDLQNLVTVVRSNMQALVLLDYPIDKLSEQFLMLFIAKKLDSSLRIDWEDENSACELPKLDKLLKFLERRAHALQSVSKHTPATASMAVNNQKTKTTSKQPARAMVTTSLSSNRDQPKARKCALCNEISHNLAYCEQFLKLPIVERYQKVMELKLCLNCLYPAHQVKSCPSRYSCKSCKGRHHSTLHSNEYVPSSNSNQVSSVQQSDSCVEVQATSNHSTYVQPSRHKQVLLSTAVILVRNKQGRFTECRALLDSASQSNFITEQCANRLGVPVTSTNVPICGLNQIRTEAKFKVQTIIRSRTTHYETKLECLMVPVITNQLPSHTIDISAWAIPSHIRLADPGFNVSSSVDMLIGADVFFKILQGRTMQVHQDLPPLRQSSLGWIIAGAVEPISDVSTSFVTMDDYNQSQNSSSEDEPLTTILQKFWELESVPSASRWSPEEVLADEHFSKNVSRSSDGRYTVKLPLKETHKQLGSTKEVAERRFSYIERKLEANSELKLLYHQFISEYIQLGHMSKVDVSLDPDDVISFTLPHHAVLKPTSTTTKLRVVFDASLKSSSGISLNDILMVGPTIQQSLFDIMLRSRKHQYMFSSDAEKMYRQINVHASDTKLQRIVWRTSPAHPLDTFELTTVTYGTSAAPFLATRTLAQLAIDEASNFPLGCQVLTNDFYVDDVVSGADTIELAKHKIHQTILTLKSGGFKLRKWCANCPDLLVDIPACDQEDVGSNGVEAIKTLGILWNPLEDEFFFNIKPPISSTTITKRIVLSDVAKVFDPFGFLAPSIISAKIMLQTLWTLKLEWDDPLPQDMQQEWLEFVETLIQLNEIRMPRCVVLKDYKLIELHGYSDASQKAYGACVYIRTIDHQGVIKANLLCSKSRVAPIKTISTNRLELCGALLLANLTSAVINAMQIEFHNVILRSDSTITLQWIRTSPHKLSTFEANRVAEIQRITNHYVWDHVGTHENPADPLSRGVKPSELKDLSIWWNGPDFLYQSEETWPHWTSSISDEELPGMRAKPKSVMVSVEEQSFPLLTLYSSFVRLLRITAWCKRFINKCRFKLINPQKDCPTNEKLLTADELQQAKYTIVKMVQRVSFPNEIKDLQDLNKRQVSKSSNIKGLNPFIDQHGVMRVGGRLDKAKHISYDAKHQMLLPYYHHVTLIIMRHHHLKNFHAGPQSMHASVRSEFWPIRGTQLARKVHHQCVICFKYKPACMQQLMGNLPEARITPSRPFATCGVDLCGHFFIKNKNQRKGSPIKCYVLDFVCFATKAIHLEIVLDQSTDTFLAAFKRFIARRGRPAIMWSDHGRNFEGAKHKMNDSYQKFITEIQEEVFKSFLSINGIKWEQIPPYTPSFGGLWEAAVKSFKTHFKRVAGTLTPTYEEMLTIVTEIEGILNSRPLTPLSVDPSDMEPLTPGHFLTGGPITSIPEPSLVDVPSNRLKNWDKITKVVQSFWKRYSTEYLNTLQNRNKWQIDQDDIRIGELVILKDRNIPSHHWPMARVTQIEVGDDGHVRMVHLKTANGTTSRGITKLCKLPIDI